MNIQPARTVRWILGWSFTAIRLPDVNSYPRDETSVLKHHNTVNHETGSYSSTYELREASTAPQHTLAYTATSAFLRGAAARSSPHRPW